MRPPPALWRAIAIPVLISTAAGAGAPPILTASDVEPTLLDSLSIDGELLAAAVSPSGERAALAYRSDDPKTERSLLRLLALDREPPATVELPGLVRDLLFAVDGSGTFVIVFKPVRREQGRSALMWIGFDDPRPSNVLRLPPTAASLDYWAADRSLIVSARNELSTIRLDGLRSGRLFRVPGDNHSVVTLGSSSLVLVGQADRILLIDLDDPPGEEEIAPRDSVPVDAPVIELAAAPNGAHALARLADGRAYRVRPWPLELTALNPASAVVAAGKTGDRRPFDPPPPAPGSDATATDGARVTTTAERVATPPVERSATPTSPPSETGVAEAPVRAADAPPPGPAPVTQAPVEPLRPAPPPASEPAAEEGAAAETAQLWGRVSGPAAADVEQVVILGPDSILTEARRVEVGPDGRWRVDGLAPGRYQIHLSGGRNRVLVAEPRVVLVELQDAAPTEAAAFHVIRSYTP